MATLKEATRRVRLIKTPHATEPGEIAITQETRPGRLEVVHYRLELQDCNVSGGSAYLLSLLRNGKVEVQYPVLTCGEESTCDCKSQWIHGGEIDPQTGKRFACKHIAACIVLKCLGKIPS